MFESELMTPKECSNYRRCSGRKLDRERAERRGPPYVRIDGRIFYRAAMWIVSSARTSAVTRALAPISALSRCAAAVADRALGAPAAKFSSRAKLLLIGVAKTPRLALGRHPASRG
jgi:hypothetical protein